MAQGVGSEFGHDEFSKLCLLAEPPCGEGLTDQFASVPKFGWIIGKSPGHAGLACQGRGHAAPCPGAVGRGRRLSRRLATGSPAPFLACRPMVPAHRPAPFIAASIVGSAAVSTLPATTCCSAGTERKLGAGHCELTASPGGRLAGDNRGRQMARHASATLTGSRGSEGRISGYVLKVIRESLGQTQEQLAERLGVSAATVQGWESGRRPLMAMPAGNLMALRAELRGLGAAPALLDHIHIVATLARQDGRQASTWNDYYRCGRRVRRRNGGSGCGQPLRPIGPPRAARPGPRPNRRPGMAGRNRPG